MDFGVVAIFEMHDNWAMGEIYELIASSIAPIYDFFIA